jgi:hypothetical protein
MLMGGRRLQVTTEELVKTWKDLIQYFQCDLLHLIVLLDGSQLES